MHSHSHHCGHYGPPQYVYSYGCGCGVPMVSAYELSVASGGPDAQALVGSANPVHLSLEYLVDDGASSPSVKVTTASDGSTSAYEETPPAAGFQVKSDFMTVQPGTKVTLAATEAAARLRWCETFCC